MIRRYFSSGAVTQLSANGLVPLASAVLFPFVELKGKCFWSLVTRLVTHARYRHQPTCRLCFKSCFLTCMHVGLRIYAHVKAQWMTLLAIISCQWVDFLSWLIRLTFFVWQTQAFAPNTTKRDTVWIVSQKRIFATVSNAHELPCRASESRENDETTRCCSCTDAQKDIDAWHAHSHELVDDNEINELVLFDDPMWRYVGHRLVRSILRRYLPADRQRHIFFHRGVLPLTAVGLPLCSNMFSAIVCLQTICLIFLPKKNRFVFVRNFAWRAVESTQTVKLRKLMIFKRAFVQL